MSSKVLRLVVVVVLASVFTAGTSVGFGKPLRHHGRNLDSGHQDINFASTRRKAQKGNSSAQYNLGVAYHRGQGVRQDFREAA